MNFCPCFEKLFGKLKPKKARAPYEGHREFEEEEFMNPTREETSLIDTISPSQKSKKAKMPKQQKKEQKAGRTQQPKDPIPSFLEQQPQAQSDLLNIKMQIEQNPRIEDKQQKDIQQLIEEELLMSPAEAVQQQIEQLKQHKEEQSKEYSYFFEEEPSSEPNFTINLDPLDPHFATLHQKTSKLYELFNKKGAKLQVGQPNKSNLQIQIIENSKINTFVLNYTLQCSYSYYVSLFKNDKLFALFSPLIAQAKTLESYKSNLTLNTLKLKRLGSLEARDCFYVKYQNGARKQHWQIFLNEQKAERSAGYKTCEIFAAKSIKQSSQRELHFTEYVQVNLESTNVSSILPKLALELRNFLNNVSSHIDRNYQQELV